MGKQSVHFVTKNEESASAGVAKWIYAINQYRTWAKGSAFCRNGKYHMVWQIYLRDTYDWQLGSPARGGLVRDGEMAILHRGGYGREFYVRGSWSINVSWMKGNPPSPPQP